jgi:hypothetical protein
MKIIFILFIWFITLGFAQGQNQYQVLYEQGLKQEKTSMLVLGSWATANIIGAFAMGRGENENNYFWQMNGYWNSVNLAIAGVGYWAAQRSSSKSQGLEVLLSNIKLEKSFLFNTALDLAYITGGLYMKEAGKNNVKERARLTGFGNSLIAQGSFLFVFDVINYAIAANRTSKIKSNLQLQTFNGTGLTISYTF